MATRVAVDDDEQQIQDLIKEMRRLRSRLATTAVTGTHDEFTAAATPSTTYTLTYIPLSGTCLMALNGHVQREGTDYTVNYDTGIVTVTATQAASDKITFRYLVTDWLIARSLPADTGGITDNFNRADSTTTLGTPWQTFATGTSTSNGWNTSTWGIASNQARLMAQPNDGFGTIATGIAYIDDVADGQLDLDLVTVSVLGEVAAFRFVPSLGTPNNRSGFVVATNRLLWLAAGAGGTQVGSTFSTAFASGDHLTVILAGSSITVQRNGSTVGAFTDTDNMTATVHGLAASATSNRYDNFSWTPT